MSENFTGRDAIDLGKALGDIGFPYLSDVTRKLAEGAISEAQRLDAIADALSKDAKLYGDAAKNFADRAIEAGQSRKADVFNRIAGEFSKVSAERAASSSGEFLGKIASEAKAAQLSSAASALSKTMPILGRAPRKTSALPTLGKITPS